VVFEAIFADYPEIIIQSHDLLSSSSNITTKNPGNRMVERWIGGTVD